MVEQADQAPKREISGPLGRQIDILKEELRSENVLPGDVRARVVDWLGQRAGDIEESAKTLRQVGSLTTIGAAVATFLAFRYSGGRAALAIGGVGELLSGANWLAGERFYHDQRGKLGLAVRDCRQFVLDTVRGQPEIAKLEAKFVAAEHKIPLEEVKK